MADSTLDKLIKEAGLTVRDFADRSSVHRTTLGVFIRTQKTGGRTPSITQALFNQIADALEKALGRSVNGELATQFVVRKPPAPKKKKK